MDFSEPVNIVTDSQYAEKVVLHIETAELIPDESELTSLFIQLQDIIRNRKHPLYITHIRSHTGLPGPLAQGNDEIDKLLIGNVLEASEFHKKHHVNSKGLKRDFSITWQQAKEIVRKCPTCSFYNQTLLPAGYNPKGTQRNEIWKIDVFHFAEFGKLKYVHHTIDTYSGFQWATALSSEKADSVITHLLEVMAIMGIPAQIKTDNAPAYVSGEDKLWIPSKLIKVQILNLKEELENERTTRAKVEGEKADLTQDLEDVKERLEEAGGSSLAQMEITKQQEAKFQKLRYDMEETTRHFEETSASLKKRHAENLAQLECQVEHLQQAEMGRRQCKSTYSNMKNKTSPESSPPPTPTPEHFNVKAEENDLKNSLMKMIEEALKRKMKNAIKEIEEKTNKKLEDVNKEIEEKNKNKRNE
ncbi:hypothetical protein STEG23_034935 [Scotinomys teguina]